MTLAEELTALYDQWRSLTEHEGRAIDEADWSQVEHCQSAKAQLQPRIVEVSQRLEVAVHETQFRPVVDQLMELERINRLRLQKQHQATEQRRKQLDRTSRNLRQLHNSYVPPARANWQSYS